MVERDNVGVALQWAVEHADADTVARLLAYRGAIENFAGVPNVGPDGARALVRVAEASVPLRAEALLWTAYAQFDTGTQRPFRRERHASQRGSAACGAKLELMGCMMGFPIDAPASRMNAGDSEDTASTSRRPPPNGRPRVGRAPWLGACGHRQ